MRRAMWFVPLAIMVGLAADAAVQVSFQEHAATATGVTPGGEVAWFAVGRDDSQGLPEVFKWFRVTEGVGGTATLDMGRPIPEVSLWAVVDVTTGQSTITTPGGDVPARIASLPEADVTRTRAGGAAGIHRAGRGVLLLIVRPGVGAWFARAIDGGGTDADGARDGVATVSLERQPALGRAPAGPGGLRAGDVAILLDEMELRAFVLERPGSGGSPQPEARTP